jgi:hypothetical protein
MNSFSYGIISKIQHGMGDLFTSIKVKCRLPRRLDEKHIKKTGRELARFHLACSNVCRQLPISSKNLVTDIHQLIKNIQENTLVETKEHKKMILEQCDIFLRMPSTSIILRSGIHSVFVGLNIGNFSITQEGKFTHAGIMTGS